MSAGPPGERSDALAGRARRSEDRAAGPGPGPSRRSYRPPEVVFFGDLRDLTLGGSPGVGDSGGGVLIQNPLP